MPVTGKLDGHLFSHPRPPVTNNRYLCQKFPFLMLKLLFWGAVIFLVYRYFMVRKSLKAEGKKQSLHRQENQEPSKGEKEGEYIDFEEIK